MATVSNLTKVSVNTQLNNGTIDGKVKTLGVSLGSLNITGYEDDKAMNIVNLLAQCLAKPVYSVQKVAVSTLTNE